MATPPCYQPTIQHVTANSFGYGFNANLGRYAVFRILLVSIPLVQPGIYSVIQFLDSQEFHSAALINTV